MIRKAFPLTIFILLFLVSLTPTNAIHALYSEDVTSSSFYIESSHYSKDAGYAFNDNPSYWYSGESGAGVYGVSYLGQDFGESVVYEIRRVGYLGFGTSSYSVTSYLLQYSSNGADWDTCGVATVSVMWQEQYSNFPACGTYRYWRLLANSSTGSSYWIVTEIEMFEYIEDATPTVTATPTITPTPTNTPLPISYASTLSSGAAYEIERSATFGEIALFAIMAFISVILLVGLFVRISTNANTNS